MKAEKCPTFSTGIAIEGGVAGGGGGGRNNICSSRTMDKSATQGNLEKVYQVNFLVDLTKNIFRQTV